MPQADKMVKFNLSCSRFKKSLKSCHEFWAIGLKVKIFLEVAGIAKKGSIWHGFTWSSIHLEEDDENDDPQVWWIS